MSLSGEYTKDQLQTLESSARDLLGSEIIFSNLRVPGVSANIRERTLNTRGQLAIAISAIELYPTQNTVWQQKVERGAAGRGGRAAHQIYADFSSGNPLVSVVLPRGPKAMTDPLAVIKRVIAATGKTSAGEFSWKTLLTDSSLGIPQEQLRALMDAMNFTSVSSPHSPVHITKNVGVSFESEPRSPGDGAHADLQSKLVLTSDAKIALAAVLKQRLRDQE